MRFGRKTKIAVLVAVFLLVATAAVAQTGFGDTSGNPFEDDIDWLADAGITNGCGGGDYCPDDPVTRAEMAAFMHRFFTYIPLD